MRNLQSLVTTAWVINSLRFAGLIMLAIGKAVMNLWLYWPLNPIGATASSTYDFTNLTINSLFIVQDCNIELA